MTRLRNSFTVFGLVALLLVSSVVPMVSLGAGVGTAAAAGAPGGMVGVPDSNVQDIRADSIDRTVTESDLEGAVVVSDHASTTEVSLVTAAQAKDVARGASPSDVAFDAVCSSPAAGRNSVFNCDQDTSIALVISDDQHHDGRRVAVRTDVVREALGRVPESLTIANNETGEMWTTSATVQDGWLVASVEHFSSNSVTWSGEYDLQMMPASDGASTTYDINDLDAADNFAINITGTMNSAWANESATNVGSGTAVSVAPDGNEDPIGDSANGQPTVEMTGRATKSLTNFSTTDGADQFIGTVSGTAVKSEMEVETGMDTLSGVKVRIYDETGDVSQPVDIYVVKNDGVDGVYGEGTLVKENWDPSKIAGKGTYNIGLDTAIDASTADNVTVEFVTASGGSGDNYARIRKDGSPSNSHFTYDDGTLSEPNVHAGIELQNPPHNVTVEDDAGHSVNLGNFHSHETKTGELPVTLSTSSISWSGADGVGEADLTLQKKERTLTEDPTITVNGNPTSYSGKLSAGSTVSLDTNTSWLQESQNTVNVSLTDPGGTAPTPQVDLDYSHDAVDTQSVNYTAEQWTDRYNVSKTFSSERVEATLKFTHEHTVVAMRDLEYRINESGGWSTVTDSNYQLDGNDLTVDIDGVYGGTVPAGTTVAFRSNASKVKTHNVTLTVVEATPLDEKLNTKVRVESISNGAYIGVGPTAQGSRVHYLTSESWEQASEYSVIDAYGNQHLHLPNAVSGGTAYVTHLDTKVMVSSGDVEFAVARAGSEPKLDIAPGPGGSGDSVTITHYATNSGTTYLLEHVKDSGNVLLDSEVAQSPVTLDTDDSNRLLGIFAGSDSGTGSGDDGGADSSSRGAGTGGLSVGSSLFVVLAFGLVTLAWFLSQRFGSGSISTSTYLYLAAALVGVFGLELLSPASLVNGIISIFGTFLAGASEAWPLIILVGGALAYYWLSMRKTDASTPDEVTNNYLEFGQNRRK